MKGFLYYFWGIPGSGKTTLTKYAREKMRKYDVKCAILDDEIMMWLNKKRKLKLFRMLEEDYDFIFICTVGPPTWINKRNELRKYRLINLIGDWDRSFKRHKEPHQEKEYAKYWIPWAECFKCSDIFQVIWRLEVKNRKIREVWKELYNEIVKHDFYKLSINNK